MCLLIGFHEEQSKASLIGAVMLARGLSRPRTVLAIRTLRRMFFYTEFPRALGGSKALVTRMSSIQAIEVVLVARVVSDHLLIIVPISFEQYLKRLGRSGRSHGNFQLSHLEWHCSMRRGSGEHTKLVPRTKETNVAHAPHHPENPLKFSQIHSKRGNMRNGGCSAGIVNIHRLFPKGRHTMNAKMMSHLKDLGITLSL